MKIIKPQTFTDFHELMINKFFLNVSIILWQNKYMIKFKI